MKRIKLSQGKYALVDDADYEWLMQWKWYANKIGKTFYAVRNFRKNKKGFTIYMHRVIMRPPPGMEVDHRRGNGLDNRRSQIKVCTHAENLHNPNGLNIKNKSGYTGVCWDKQMKKWRATIHRKGRTIFIGLYTSKIAASRARNRYEKTL